MKELRKTPLSRQGAIGGVQKGILMLKSKRLGAIVFALWTVFSSTISNSPFASAQADGRVQPLLNVATAGSNGVVGLTPAQMRRAYGFDQITNKGKGQIIGIVDAFDHPAIEQDLKVFNNTFGLSPCTVANGCLRKVWADDTQPPSNGCSLVDIDLRVESWALEIALDVEWAHAIAPEAQILLVEAGCDELSDLIHAVDVAVRKGASVVSMSWGLPEEILTPVNQTAYDGHFVPNRVTFFASAGDTGHGIMYPAASPYVMGVGGTTLKVDKDGNYLGETAFNRSGGGLSSREAEPVYQITYPIPNNPELKRGIPDVAYDADPNTGVAVYDSIPFRGTSGWREVGGTSVGPPQWSGLIAIANSVRSKGDNGKLTGRQGVLYDASKDDPSSYHDIVKGKNDNCGDRCQAVPGYDYVTGLGTPQADSLIQALKRN
jgi:subtilase family serine protease